MSQNRFLKFTASALAALVLTAGCDQPANRSSRIPAPFEDAAAPIKQAWEQALAADKASDYATAMTALDRLQKMKLTDAQQVALSSETAKFSEHLLQAVMRNDPAAMRAYQNSQKQTTPR